MRKLRGLMPLVSADTCGERPYYVMPYFEGGVLTQYAGRLTGSQLYTVAADVASTLANLHASYDVHGDINLNGELWEDIQVERERRSAVVGVCVLAALAAAALMG
jgi:serine/threonine protein kinase